MSNEVQEVKTKRSVIITMAERFEMDPKNFETTLRATIVPKNITTEQFAAFLIVANKYNLDPLTREIYAFSANGGIKTIVSVDGWIRMINSHPKFDGLDFIYEKEGGKLISITCKIYRKDHTHPTIVTEYMDECKGTTEVWKRWPARMLRHKALIQAGRYAFGFSDIVDPDEADRINLIEDITPPKSNIDLEEAISAKENGTYLEQDDMINNIINGDFKEEITQQSIND